jgi:beta-lactamase superfamily II metal-dependent hydrolase
MGGLDIDLLAAEPFEADRAEPNGSSIAVLAEYNGGRLVLAADAHADGLVESRRSLAGSEGGRLRCEAFKLTHHGNKHSVSKELLDQISCPRFLVSTNGA